MSCCRLIQLATLALLAVAGPAAAQSRTFVDPEHDGFALGYCDARGVVCGEQIATRWCHAHGHQNAREWSIRPGIDFSSATITLDGAGICRGAHCDAFASITCGGEEINGGTLRMPRLGGQAHATLVAPNRRTTEAAVEPVEYQVRIPGCDRRETGAFLCESVRDYQHCRTLMQAGRVHACRAGLAFDGGIAEPVAAQPGSYALDLRSNAEVVVERDRRGEARVRGEARYEVSFESPDGRDGMWCLQRDRYTYHPTGPQGGLSSIDDTADCDTPITGSFGPHEDDVLQAYDLCEAFGAWGEELEQPMELLVASLFTVGSAHPAFVSANRNATKIVAPYLTLQAPLKVTCKG